MGKVAKTGIFAGKKISVDADNLKIKVSNFLNKSPFSEICARILDDKNSVEDYEILFNQAPLGLLLSLVNLKGFNKPIELTPVLHLPVQRRLASEDREVVLNTFVNQIESLGCKDLTFLIGIHDYYSDYTDIHWVINSLKFNYPSCDFLSPAVSSIVSGISRKFPETGRIKEELESILKKLKSIGINETFGSVSPVYSECLDNVGFPVNYLQVLDKFPSGREYVESLLRSKNVTLNSWTCGYSKLSSKQDAASYDEQAIRAFAIARLILKDIKIRIRSYSLSLGILDIISHLGLNSIMLTAADKFTQETVRLYLHEDIQKLDGNWK